MWCSLHAIHTDPDHHMQYSQNKAAKEMEAMPRLAAVSAWPETQTSRSSFKWIIIDDVFIMHTMLDTVVQNIKITINRYLNFS